MNWSSVSDFFAMGGRGFYVWGSYGVSFALIGLEIGLLIIKRRQTLRQLFLVQKLENQNELQP